MSDFFPPATARATRRNRNSFHLAIEQFVEYKYTRKQFVALAGRTAGC